MSPPIGSLTRSGDVRPPSVLTTLHAYVFHLRQALEPPHASGAVPRVIITVPGGYRLDTTAVTADALRFEDHVAAGRAALPADPATAAELLRQGLAMWRGEVLSDLGLTNDFIAPVAARLAELRLVAFELWAEARLALGDLGVLEELDPLVSQHPLREHVTALLMLALYRAGRQADALATYRRLWNALDTELGIRPSREVQTLHQQMLRQDASLSRPWPAADLRSDPRRPTGAVSSTASAARLRRAESTPLPALSVGPVDGRGLRGRAVRLAGTPSALVGAANAVWALEGDADALIRIDPNERRITQTVHGVGHVPQAIAVVGEELWVVAFGERVVTRVDIRTAKAGHKLPVGVDPVAVVGDSDGIWVANSGDNTVVRIDPATEFVDAPIFVDDGPAALALHGSSLWVANERSGTVSQIDARTGERAAADVRVDAGPSALAVTDSDVWVANESGQSVSRISLGTGRVHRIDVDDGPSSLVVVDQQVWVANRYSGTISVIDVRTNGVTTVAVGSAPTALTEVNGEVWVGSGSLGDREHRGGTLVWEGTVIEATVDPAYAYFPTNSVLLRSVYDSLVAFRMASGRVSLGLVPDLATSLPEPADGGRTYVFTIRAGIRYSTGDLVKASDFVRGLTRALQPGASYPDLLQSITGATEFLTSGTTLDLNHGVTADDATGRFTIRLDQPDPELLEKLSLLLYPAPVGTPAHDQGWEPIPGTGPYMVTSAGGDGVTLARNPYFRQWSAAAQPDGYPDVISYRQVTSESEAIGHVLDGSASVTVTVDPLPLSVTTRPAFVHRFQLLDVQMINPNATVPPFDDRRVRQALNYAIDRNASEILGGGTSEDATPTCQLIPPGIPGHRYYFPYQSGPPDGPYQGPDLDRARQLVAESETAAMPITVYHGPHASLKDRAEFTANVLRELGYAVTVAPVEVDAPTSVTDLYQIQAHWGWMPDYFLPGTYFDTQVGCGVTTYSHFCDESIQAEASRARSLRRTDPAGSLVAWAHVDRMLTDEAALVPLVNRVGAVVVHPDIGNVMTRAGFGPLLSQMWVR
jgi:YVTN family beta-propeller protein